MLFGQHRYSPDFKRLGTVRGFTPWDFLDYIKNGSVQVSENRSFVGLLKQTILGRVDGAYINVSVAHYQLESELKKPQALVFAKSLPHTQSAYLMSTIKYPDIINVVNQCLQEQKEAINALKIKYKVETISMAVE